LRRADSALRETIFQLSTISGTLPEAAEEASEFKDWFAAHIFPENGFWWAPDKLFALRKQMEAWDLINSPLNGFWTNSRRHLGTHTKAYVEELLLEFKGVKSREGAISALERIFAKIEDYKWGPH
jgi:hypothetical protein